MSINSILFTTTSGIYEPALLNVGKTNNYDKLAAYLAQEEQPVASQVTDQVDLALDKVADKIISELASITANTIGDYPQLSDDYVIAVIDDANGIQARVYSRQAIVDSFEGTEEEKKSLLDELNKQPLKAYPSSYSLPASDQSEASAALANKINTFLSQNGKLLDLLETYGYNPFSAIAAS
ncbi:MAG: hypothetical protein LBV23_02850 [Deltaproteobacteria bacterium]|nr:hypothetical protein [Deltaproteobacteria bacterium]